ncbi:uncharacterized protein BDR25DRAFT_385881 [Lindgomyces ingoldianus]|uniref:Uncharacterized protein n=1 Tax=Lindgomyces ingoldianus TaxID=673940 RepID=A0ACB6R588_9PLEO|nr:uncharacterized protein BDR25DRAFT_385881 [Lindgomyces ingoldianus]KAF2474346.1 hypothetical protein BDR25DRAFT_385881 [Lindgomyces ingoldianus]
MAAKRTTRTSSHRPASKATSPALFRENSPDVTDFNNGNNGNESTANATTTKKSTSQEKSTVKEKPGTKNVPAIDEKSSVLKPKPAGIIKKSIIDKSTSATEKAAKAVKLKFKLRLTPPFGSSSDDVIISAPAKSKRSQVPAACLSCRSRKIACDGTRPTCNRCAGRGLTCEYDVGVGETREGALRRQVAESQARVAELEHQLAAQTQLANDALAQLQEGERAYGYLRDLAKTKGGVKAIHALVRMEKSFPVLAKQMMAIAERAGEREGVDLEDRILALTEAAMKIAGI